MDGMADISKILGIIMENPEIIEKIKDLAASSKNDSSEEAAEATFSKNSDTVDSESQINTDKTTVEAAAKPAINTKKKRHDLLCAIKPYVSEGRGKAIDTMLSVIDVLDIMKAR